MKRVVAVTVGLSISGLAAQAAAQAEPPDRALSLGVRTGIALPGGGVGDFEENADAGDLSDGVRRVIPVMLEANFRLTQNFAVGALFQYGFASVKTCDDLERLRISADCSGSVKRLGAQVLFTPAAIGRLVPWVGFGAGYEWLSFRIEGSGGGQSVTLDGTAHGFEWAHLQGGLDVLATPTFRIGPFVDVSFGQYRRATSSGNVVGANDSQSGDLKTTAVHEWYTVGVRGTFDIAL